MESQETKWLKKRYRPAPTEGEVQNIKKIKFEHIRKDMTAQFPSKNLSNYQVSQAITTAFPNTFSRQSTHSRTKHIFGLEEITDTPSSSSVHSIDLEAENRRLRLQVDDQQHRLQVMQNRIEDLERQIAQLQKHIDSFSCVQSPSLESQVGGLLSSQNAVYHGPDTVTHFHDFSMDHVITEFKKQAPDVWQLLNNLGNTGRFSEDTEQHQLAQLRIVSCLSTLLKTRSHKSLGVQLLVSLMLIARATSRRVGTPICMK